MKTQGGVFRNLSDACRQLVVNTALISLYALVPHSLVIKVKIVNSIKKIRVAALRASYYNDHIAYALAFFKDQLVNNLFEMM